MKICFNQATTMKNSNLEKDLEYCEKDGYDLIEIRLDKLQDYLTRHTVEDLANFFDKSNINCKKIVVVPTFDVGGFTKTEIKEESVKKITKLAKIAGPFGVKLAFEFVGYPNCSVNRFDQAYEIVQAVDLDNVGVVLDCFHFHAMGSRIEDLKAAEANKIFIFHIDDSEDLPVGAARDDKRLWPGDGAVDLDAILSTLKEIGYDEMVSVELFRPEYWDWDTEKTIKVGKEKTKKVVSKYFDC